jgi:hypothetical protein
MIVLKSNVLLDHCDPNRCSFLRNRCACHVYLRLRLLDIGEDQVRIFTIGNCLPLRRAQTRDYKICG